jgi:hypothetical protein
MHIRIVTFGLNVSAEDYQATAAEIAPDFTDWPGLIAKWWLADSASAQYGGVYLFASREDADRSRDTELFATLQSPAFRDVTIREYDVLEAPTSITAAVLQAST